MAFDRGADGELLPAFEAREMPDERRAIQTAKEMSHRHEGVIAWARDADPLLVGDLLILAGLTPEEIMS